MPNKDALRLAFKSGMIAAASTALPELADTDINKVFEQWFEGVRGQLEALSVTHKETTK